MFLNDIALGILVVGERLSWARVSLKKMYEEKGSINLEKDAARDDRCVSLYVFPSRVVSSLPSGRCLRSLPVALEK